MIKARRPPPALLRTHDAIRLGTLTLLTGRDGHLRAHVPLACCASIPARMSACARTRTHCAAAAARAYHSAARAYARSASASSKPAATRSKFVPRWNAASASPASPARSNLSVPPCLPACLPPSHASGSLAHPISLSLRPHTHPCYHPVRRPVHACHAPSRDRGGVWACARARTTRWQGRGAARRPRRARSTRPR
jgi:hypothetical protein